jgi:hypothetical protein
MKQKKLFRIACLLIGFLFSGSLAFAADPLVVNAAKGNFAIDADGGDWGLVTATNIDYVNYGGTNLTAGAEAADFSGSFKTAWDAKKLYFYIDVKDDIKVKANGASYLVDNMEIWLDVNKSKTTAFDGVDDIKIRINRDSVWANTAAGQNNLGDYPWTQTSTDGMKGMVVKQKEVNGGYIVEVSIPWDSIQVKNPNKIAIAENTEIGFGIYLCDQDDAAAGGTTRTKLFWGEATTVAGNPSTWGTIKLAGTPIETTLVSQAAKGKFAIDADGGDWGLVTATPVGVVSYGAANLTAGSEAADFSGSFKTAWDKKNFYMYIDVKDDVKVKKGTFYLVDNLELQFDLDNSKGNSNDGKNDLKIRINRDTTLVNGKPGDNVLGDYPWTASSTDGMKGMVVAQKEVNGGYIVELSIPWDSIQATSPSKVTINENSEVGFAVYLCDQDDPAAAGGATRTKLLWTNFVGNKPSTYGTLKLAGTPIETTLVSQAAKGKFAIDADGGDWGLVTATPVGVVSYGAANLTAGSEAADFSGSFKTAWDKKNFYMYIDVKDDVKVKKGTFYLVDNLELQFDLDNSKGNSNDGKNDLKIRINRDTTLVNGKPGDNVLGDYPWTASSTDGMKGMVVAQKEVNGGYIVELSIPWDSIQATSPSKVTINENSEVGFAVYLCDQDDPAAAGGATRTKLLWTNFVGNKPSTYGTLKLAGTPVETVLESQAIANSIIIDGNNSDWQFANTTPVSVVTYGAANLTAGSEAADFSGSFKTAWDKKNFYMYIDVKDDVKVKKGTFYLVDNLELQFDLDNSKGNSNDGKNDLKIRINRDTTLVNGKPGDNILGDYPWTASSTDGMKGMVVAQKEVNGGYVVELSIPWDSIQATSPSKVSLKENSEVGFAVYLCDQDDAVGVGGATRTKLVWTNFVGNKPSTYGTLKLVGTPSSVRNAAETQVKIYRIAKSVYVTDLSSLTGSVNISIYNLNGSRIQNISTVGGEKTQINLNGFAKGMYILKLENNNQNSTMKLIAE